MQSKFRSRGIKYNVITKKITMKRYYDPDYEILSINPEINIISKHMDCLEYSKNDAGIIDSINFHTNCIDIEPFKLFEFNDFISNNIITIFDETYKAYTLGYRLKGTVIDGMSIYYYPTTWKFNRLGICGTTNTDKIMQQIDRFMEGINATVDLKKSMKECVSKIEKFKGCCITINGNDEISYKLYFKMKQNYIKEFFVNMLDVNVFEKMFGKTVLIAIRFENSRICGYNFYYLK